MYFDFSGQKKIFDVISNVIDEELPSTMTAGINYAASPGVIIPLLMLLGQSFNNLVNCFHWVYIPLCNQYLSQLKL